MDTTTDVPTTSDEEFTSPNPFLGETATIAVAGHDLPGQRTLNEVPTQRTDA